MPDGVRRFDLFAILAVTLSPKIILHAPVSDEALLVDFVERCLRDGVSLIAILGPDSERLEDVIDDLVVGDGSIPGRFLVTMAQGDDPIDETMELVRSWDSELGGGVEDVRL